MVEQPSKNETALLLVEMLRRLVQQYDRALRKPRSGEAESLRLAKRELILPNPAVEPASALKPDVELYRRERPPQCLIGLRAGEQVCSNRIIQDRCIVQAERGHGASLRGGHRAGVGKENIVADLFEQTGLAATARSGENGWESRSCVHEDRSPDQAAVGARR
jgi:hypothetical protein